MKILVSQGINTLYIKYKCTAYPCESYHFNYTWKTLEWPHHFTERGSLGILNLFDPVTVKWLTWDRGMSGQLYICVCGIDFISVSTIFYLTLKLSDDVVLFIHSLTISQYYKLYNARTTYINCNSKSNFVGGNHPLDRWSLYHINYFPCLVFTEIFEDTKGLIRIRISQKGRKYKEKGQKDKQWSTKHYT